MHVKPHIIPCLRLPEADVLGGEANDVADLVNDTSPGAPRADIDADIVVLLDVDFIPHVDRVLSNGRPDSAEWDLCHLGGSRGGD